MNHYQGSVPETLRPTRWETEAACKGMGKDGEIFFASDSNTTALNTARSVCSACPSKTDCLTAAFQEGDEYGIRGGLTRRQRLYFLRKNNHDIDRAIAESTGNVAVIIRRIYHHHAEPTAGGHVLWTDRRKLIPVLGEQYTVHRLAWWAHHGQAPVGTVTRVCDVERCVAKACLADRQLRNEAAAARKKTA